MAKVKKIGGLGKGLEALIPVLPDGYDDASDAGMADNAVSLPLDSISANPYQARREFDDVRLSELADSIRQHGVLSPVLVRRLGEGYQLVAGERRARAARLAGITEIPAFIRELSEREMMEISLIENIQRQDLNPVEEARAYKRLSSEFGLTQDQIAARVAKSRPYVANSIRLLNLPDVILGHLASGKLSVGHTRPLLPLNEENAINLAERLIGANASAREAEQWARELAVSEKGVLDDGSVDSGDPAGVPVRLVKGVKELKPLSVALKEILRVIRERVNTKVDITRNAKGGKIIIEYYNDDDLERILELFTGSLEIE